MTFAQEEIVLTKKRISTVSTIDSPIGEDCYAKTNYDRAMGISHEEDTGYSNLVKKKLQSKIGDSGGHQKYIFTIAGWGYVSKDNPNENKESLVKLLLTNKPFILGLIAFFQEET